MLKNWILSLLMLMVGSSLWALPEGRLLRESETGQTVLFTLGLQDGLSQGEFGVVVKEIATPDTPDLRLVPVARGRSVRLSKDRSIWYLFRKSAITELI